MNIYSNFQKKWLKYVNSKEKIVVYGKKKNNFEARIFAFEATIYFSLLVVILWERYSNKVGDCQTLHKSRQISFIL